jgi:hypothetical protein
LTLRQSLSKAVAKRPAFANLARKLFSADVGGEVFIPNEAEQEQSEKMELKALSPKPATTNESYTGSGPPAETRRIVGPAKPYTPQLGKSSLLSINAVASNAIALTMRRT